MNKDDIIKQLEELKEKLGEIEKKFGQIKPLTDWNKIRIGPLKDYIDNFEKMVRRIPDGNYNKRCKDIEQAIAGLRKVLDSETRFYKA